ncbi:MAG TPA: hypothetical protein VG407_02205 [Caulobacteraceae bacterium]|nr:hypothetical protein [Caulobacteraceae bacterium]
MDAAVAPPYSSPMKYLRLPLLALVCATALAVAPRVLAAGGSSISLAEAAKTFAEMHRICARDGGKFWGISECGPILFVDPNTRDIVANGPDKDGVLTREGDVWVGHMPDSENISNAPMTWSGTAWTELMWPLPPMDEERRHTMMAHEMFHRIQPQLKLTRPDNGASHLDTLEGRYWLQLEWRALTRALRATSPAERRRATIDALDFRAERYRLFPKAAESERDLEYAEGLAEYTGLHIGLTSPAARVGVALADLHDHATDASFMRTFAYATGPSYGLLLDRYAPAWRKQLANSRSFDQILRQALHAPVPADIDARAKAEAARYDGAALRRSEVAREDARLKRIAGFRVKFVDGPVLYLPMHHANVSFRPVDLQPLGDKATVYTILRVSADWGVLDVTGGALLKTDFSGVTVSVAGVGEAPIKGDGWTLTLKPGWRVVAGSRKGDFTVADH